MHHGTDTLDSVSGLDFPVIWGGWNSLAPVRPRRAERHPFVRFLIGLAGGTAFAATVWLAVFLLAVL